MTGVGFFALRSKAAVVPCAVIGPYKRFARLKVEVYGPPIQMDELCERKASADEVTEAIMKGIGKLIEKYQIVCNLMT